MNPKRWVPWASVATLLLIWLLAGAVGLLSSSSMFPTVPATLKAFQQWAEQGVLMRDVPVSLARVCLGFLVGGSLGVVLGLLTGRLALLSQIVSPPLNIYRALPPIAVVPFLFLVLGMSETSRVFLVALGVFFPVWVSTHEGASVVDRGYLEVAADLGFSRMQTSVRVVFPATLSYTSAGIRTGIAMAYIMLFIAEWVGANTGIGYQLSVAHTVSSTDHMLVGLILLGMLAYGTDLLYGWGIRRLFPWMVS